MTNHNDCTAKKDSLVMPKNYVAEAGYIVSLFDKKNKIFKIDGIHLVDSNFGYKAIKLSSFISNYLGFFNDFRVTKLNKNSNLFIDGMNSRFLSPSGDGFFSDTSFWRLEYEYYIVKFKDLCLLGIDDADFINKIIGVGKFKLNSYIIVGIQPKILNGLGGDFVIANVMYGVTYNEKTVIKPKFPCMHLLVHGIFTDVYFENSNFILAPGKAVKYNLPYLVCNKSVHNNHDIYNLFHYYLEFYYPSFYRADISNIAVNEFGFIGIGSQYTLSKDWNFSSDLIFPKNCTSFFVSDIYNYDNLSKITTLVLNKCLDEILFDTDDYPSLISCTRTNKVYMSKETSPSKLVGIILCLLGNRNNCIIKEFKHILICYEKKEISKENFLELIKKKLSSAIRRDLELCFY